MRTAACAALLALVCAAAAAGSAVRTVAARPTGARNGLVFYSVFWPWKRGYVGTTSELPFDLCGAGNGLSYHLYGADVGELAGGSEYADAVFASDVSRDGLAVAFSVDSATGSYVSILFLREGSSEVSLTDGSAGFAPDGRSMMLESDGRLYREPVPGSGESVPGPSSSPLTPADSYASGPRFSPDGGKVAFTLTREGGSSVAVMNADGTDIRTLTADGDDAFVAWSPDGTQLLYNRGRYLTASVWTMRSDGTEQRRIGSGSAGDWSPDGKLLDVARGDALWAMSLDGRLRRVIARGPLMVAGPWQPLPVGGEPLDLDAYRRCVGWGTARSDTLRGSELEDVLVGNGGADVLIGLAGEDRLEGGPGADTLRPGDHGDIVLGGPGNDFVYAADGWRDRISCGSGIDTAVVDQLDRVSDCEHVTRLRRT